jgi:hypothetical protein
MVLPFERYEVPSPFGDLARFRENRNEPERIDLLQG